MAQVSFFETGARRYGVAISGIEAINNLDEMPASILRYARMAVNATLDKARTMARDRMLAEVNFPRSYLDPSQGRLTVVQYASELALEGRIKGREEPTSLARFVIGRPKPLQKGGLSVMVKPGQTRSLPRAFIFPLKNNNLGLAIRTDGGRAPDRAWKPKQLKGGLWLLYGPAVAQVFNEVRGEIGPSACVYMENEFNRLMGAKI